MKKFIIAGIIGYTFGLIVSSIATEELSVSTGFSYNKNGISVSLAQSSPKYTVTGNGKLDNIQSISTNILGDLLVMGGVANVGFMYAKNVGPAFDVTNNVPTNRIQIGYSDGTNFFASIEINTNEVHQSHMVAPFPLRAKATGTNAVRLSYTIVDR